MNYMHTVQNMGLNIHLSTFYHDLKNKINQTNKQKKHTFIRFHPSRSRLAENCIL